MARVGLLGRIMLLLLGALSLLVVATFGIGQWQRGQERSPYASRFPRLDQAGGIMALLRDADPVQRPAILRAVNGEALRAEIVDAPPVEKALIREPVLEARLHRLTGEAGDGIRAFTSADMLYRDNGPADAADGNRRKSIGSLAVATYRLPDGRTLVVSAITRHRSLMPWLLGQPLSLWVAVLGLIVAGLVTIGTRHELGPLRRLTEAVSRFDGRATEPALAQQGAPEIRRLAQAVQAMQERIVGLMGERSMLIGAISHDLKTYLTRMRLRAERVAEPERRDRLVEDVDAMTALIETSLGFARGTAEVGRAPVDLADIVAVEVAEHAAQGARISLSGEEVPDATVAGDAVALRRVVANLIGNAVKFGRSSVAVAVRRAGGACEVVVEDDGPGIPADERSAVFSPYYRVERSRNRRTGGTGLGLAIARQIAEAHGGTIVAEAAPAGGARLVMTLPALA
ncbi:UNVERIFIED_CONTAM: HAMP domain-containing sensor histidine kinase [Methylobacteriaceae bacterium AG10]|jgi:signal transduction histidine kinase|uniref:sensor histidine kinase n=1 Tax=Methylorubrum populi TaxID=223967 RepID=UPI0003742917|nr:HAMP domain-containing sensor histidine kinase [Methylorubrum populi]MDV2985129.1 HAMP domain-containing sensor histidine kinase [Methylobacteriaceae bacterium AG10]QDI83522.1 HAMP domain-containing histidine kinase [Methylorubrum populi]